MNLEDALTFTDQLVFAKTGLHLSDLQQVLLRESWALQRQSYDQIADTYGYSATYLKHDVGPKLWKLLTDVLGEKVNKTNFRTAIERRFQAEAALRASSSPSLSQPLNAIATPQSSEPNATDRASSLEITTSVPSSNPELVTVNSDNAPDPSDTNPTQSIPHNATLPSSTIAPFSQTWGEVIDVSVFYGRHPELAQLQQWIAGEPATPGQNQLCRLIAIIGMGGIGKTTLAAKLAQQLVGNPSPTPSAPSLSSAFQFVIWRSLRNAHPFDEMLMDLLRVFSNQPDAVYPKTIAAQIAQLLHYLRSHRCLLVFDNVETILHNHAPEAGSGSLKTSGTRSGHQIRGYRDGYEGYGDLFRQIGETVHSSCLVMTSREKPPEVTLLEGDTLPVRSLTLKGLQQPEAQELFTLKGTFHGTNDEWHRLIEGYSGNPLALKLVATTIQTLFNGNISDFLQQDAFVFGTIRTFVGQQFERLSGVEKTVMYWLAIYREPASFVQLRSDSFPPLPPQVLMEVLETLEHRSLIEKNTGLFSLQPVVMEYVTDHLVEHIVEEIQNGFESPASQHYPLIRSHALLIAQAKDYIRETQARLILQPILERLMSASLGTLSLQEYCTQRLAELRHKPLLEIGYAGGNVLNLLCQQHAHLNSYDFSHLAIWQAALQHVTLHDVNLSHSDLSHSVFAETLGIVFSVAFSPDGRLLATGDAEGGLRLWNVQDAKPLLDLKGHRGWVWSIAFSADGTMLASCSNDKTVRVWNVATGECLQTLQGHTSSVWSVAFSPDGKTIASGGDQPEVRLWNVGTGTCTDMLTGHTGQILALAFSVDGQTLVSGSDDQTVRVWDVATKTCRYVCQGHENRVWSVALSPNSRILASGSADRTIKVWNVETGECLTTLSDHIDRVRSVQFSADGHYLVSGSDDQTVRVWNVNTGQCLTVLRGHTNSVFSVAFNADGKTLASGSTDQTVRLWTVDGQCLKTVKGYTNSVFSVAFNADGQTLASGSTDQTVRLWDIPSGTCLNTLKGHTGWVTSVAFHPLGHMLASSSADQTIKLWDRTTGRCLNTLQGHTNWVQSVQFSPNGDLLASSGDDRTIRLWSVKTGQCVRVMAGHTGWVWSIVFSPQGDWVASSSEDQTIRVWDVQTGECLRVLEGHMGRIQSIAVSPDGTLLASGSGDETVRVWDVATGQCRLVLREHGNNVWSVAFAPQLNSNHANGHLLASGSLDQTVRVWDVETVTCLTSLPVLTHSVRSAIAFSPITVADRHILASGSHSGTIQIWTVELGQCITTLTPDKPYKGTNIANVTGITSAQKAALNALGAIEL